MTDIKFNEPYITGKELEYIKDVFEKKHFYGNGEFTSKCQDKIRDSLSAQKVLLTDSCTSALEISALLIKDWEVEQEVILPSYTFSSTASAFARAGFKLVFADVCPDTMMIDIKDVENKITTKTAAIVIVHYAGFSAGSKQFKSLCNNHGLFLIEDAAQAFGSYEEKNALGTVGDLGCFSFHETKNIHAGLAGALLINNEKFKDRAEFIWERGTNRQEVLKGIADKYSWVEIGGSFYPTELQAAFLFAQLESFDQNMAERKSIFDTYTENLLPLKSEYEIYFPDQSDNYVSNYHAFWITFSSKNECDYVREGLVKEGISAYIGYVPLHTSKVGLAMGNKEGSLPVTEDYAERILRLPFHNNMSEEDVKRVADCIVILVKEFEG